MTSGMAATQFATLYRFCTVARRIMRGLGMEANTCVASTAVTCSVLASLGFDARPQPVKFFVELDAIKTAYCAGLSQEELSGAPAVHDSCLKGDWRGHLVALIGNDFLIDPSFDQASEALVQHGAKPLMSEPICLLFPLDGLPKDEFHATYQAVFDNEQPGKVQYITTDTQGWRDSPAWNDPALSIIESVILRAIESED